MSRDEKVGIVNSKFYESLRYKACDRQDVIEKKKKENFQPFLE